MRQPWPYEIVINQQREIHPKNLCPKTSRHAASMKTCDSEQVVVSKMQARSHESWWREWPLVLTVLTLTVAWLGKGWIATALGQPALLIALLVTICSVILVAAVAIVRHAD